MVGTTAAKANPNSTTARTSATLGLTWASTIDLTKKNGDENKSKMGNRERRWLRHPVHNGAREREPRANKSDESDWSSQEARLPWSHDNFSSFPNQADIAISLGTVDQPAGDTRSAPENKKY